ncbi:MAG: glutathionylspermidine synthase family protein [Methylocystis sp.]|nr:glutathionylspermidine synthase family protein [Methylocystis sp.]MCA3582680.1 glutathionylspermidine synthase family protein [Methylocystis sp.]MCA3588683.1 glutathionylspermidine synthase family protein [Methylocystis sp.]MCA3591977.1 glutathionylspermidine synthase family protein [Methylocystis sp.]
MQRIRLTERPDWRMKAESYGFPFHTIGGEVYWDESIAWRFSLREIEEDLEAPTGELEQLCLAFVAEAIKHPAILTRLGIPEMYWSFVRESWQRGDRNLYGRFDLAYDGKTPAKLLEYNADTPTSLFEASVFQWSWLEDQMAAGGLPAGSDQFNSLHERLVKALRNIRRGQHFLLHLASVADSQEDKATVAYLADCARQAGLETKELPIEQIGIDSGGQFTDGDDVLIRVLFKLYPWEWLFKEAFGRHLPAARTQFIEPPWKALLSTKGLMPMLWEMAPNHKNLLASYFADDPRCASLGDRVEKPLHSREGANIRVIRAGAETQSTPGDYGGPAIVQALAPTAEFPGGHAIIGSWVVASEPAGIGIREDAGLITRDTARFVPHFIEGE